MEETYRVYVLFLQSYAVDLLRLWGAQENQISSVSTAPEIYDLRKRAESIALGADVSFSHTSKSAVRAITSVVSLRDNSASQLSDSYLPIGTLSTKREAVMPKPKQDSPLPEQEEIAVLSRLLRDWERCMQITNDRQRATSLMSLIRIYGSCIAYSSTRPDVSFADLTRSALGIAMALRNHEADSHGTEELLLIGGDFSGIQPFISSITSKFASKSLKGRSFYVRLLGTAVVNLICERLGLTEASVIYNSGGSFYLLASNDPSTKAALDRARQEIERKLLGEHGLGLYVSVSGVELSVDDLSDGQLLAEKWVEVFERNDECKRRRYADLITSDPDSFFLPDPESGKGLAVDAVTGEEIRTNDAPYGVGKTKFEDLRRELREENAEIDSKTAGQILLGQALRTMTHIVVSRHQVDENKIIRDSKVFCIQPASLGVYFYIVSFKANGSESLCGEWMDELREQDQNVKPATVFQIVGRDADIDLPFGVETKLGLSFDFYGNTESDRCTFDDLCRRGENEEFTRLGILRMDVDNLGAIFQRGIDASQRSLAMYTALSYSMDFFFSAYLSTIVGQINNRSDQSNARIHIIYSGGDDLFIVGRWNETIEVARCIRTEFDHYTGRNKDLSISGGITFMPFKHPIMHSAKLSAEEEGRAKKHTLSDGRQKNSISLLGMPLSWEDEYRYVYDTYREIVNAKLKSSFVSKLLMLYVQSGLPGSKAKHQIQDLSVLWIMAYDFQRFREREEKDNPAAIRLIDRCRKEVLVKPDRLSNSSYHPLELWATAARIAEFARRSNIEQPNRTNNSDHKDQ